MDAADSLKEGQIVLGNYVCTCVQVYTKKYSKILFCFREKSFNTIYFSSESNAHYCFIPLPQEYYIILHITPNSFIYILTHHKHTPC